MAHVTHSVDAAKENGYEVRFQEPTSEWWVKNFGPEMTPENESDLIKSLLSRGRHDVPEEIIRKMLSEWEFDLPEKAMDAMGKTASTIIDARLMRVAEEGVRTAEAQSKEAQGDEAQRQAALALDEAAARLDGARAMLAHLEGVRSAPLDLIAAADAARAQYRVARATAAGAAAGLALVSAGPAAHEVRLAEAAVKQAEARLKTLEVQLDKLTLVAPMAGTVTEVAVKPGETAVAGATLLGIAARAPLEITVYVAEADVGLVAPGSAATVRVDARPDRAFPGRVVHVASEAEFTPRDVKTRQDRASLVFGVRIRLVTDEDLKPGMPADVEIVKG